jgi:hypothetical protein
MKVFISWSGPISRQVAEKLRAWLRRVIPLLEPFVSFQDIEAGNVWIIELFKELKQSSAGIICISRENLHSDWLLFEAGALMDHMTRSRVCTLLIDVSPLELNPPLSEFHATTFKRDDILRLIKTLHSHLDKPLWSDEELGVQFTACWPDLETHIRDVLATPRELRTEIQELAEELLLPVIYRMAYAGDLDTVFHWLEIARRRRVADLEGHLGFVEACLARITGKRGAGANLRQQSLKEGDFKNAARLELLFLNFAAGRSITDAELDPDVLLNFSDRERRVGSTLLSMWMLREGRIADAKACFEAARPDRITGDPIDIYRAVPQGILCFAFDEGDLGEKYFDLARLGGVMPYEGWPFVSLLANFDRTFVNTCIGQGEKSLPESRIREFRGHAWVLAQYADTMRNCPSALEALAQRSTRWKVPLQQKSISDRLRQFQRELVAASGGPLMS